jgi:hypothetical protein
MVVVIVAAKIGVGSLVSPKISFCGELHERAGLVKF